LPGVLQVGQARAVLAGQEEVPQALGLRLALELPDDRRAAPPAGGRLVGEGRLGRVDVLLHEREELVTQVGGALVE